jgi:MFS transporter, FSR family, fosmidomycin resistance protein
MDASAATRADRAAQEVGFVYSGLDVGLSVAPILFGRLMDRGMFAAVLCGVALFQGLAVLAALRVGAPAAPAAASTR